MTLEEHALDCPYCGEPITLLVDASEPEQVYVEDCEVCCRPMVVNVKIESGYANVTAQHEDA